MNAEQKRKQSLENQRNELQARLEKLSGHTRHRETPLPADFAEQATELENQDAYLSIDQSTQATLKAINHALVRIEKGQGDLCERCGEDIAPARLKALAHTTLCQTCASAEVNGVN